MSEFSYSGLDIAALIVLILAVAALVWAFRGGALAGGDEEASAVLWSGDEPNSEQIPSTKGRIRPRTKRFFIVVFIALTLSLILAPLLTIFMAQSAVAHKPAAASTGFG